MHARSTFGLFLASVRTNLQTKVLLAQRCLSPERLVPHLYNCTHTMCSPHTSPAAHYSMHDSKHSPSLACKDIGIAAQMPAFVNCARRLPLHDSCNLGQGCASHAPRTLCPLLVPQTLHRREYDMVCLVYDKECLASLKRCVQASTAFAVQCEAAPRASLYHVRVAVSRASSSHAAAQRASSSVTAQRASL